MLERNLNIILGAGFSFDAGIPLANGIKSKFDRPLQNQLARFTGDHWVWREHLDATGRHNGTMGSESNEYAFILEEIIKGYKTKAGSFIDYEDFYQYVIDIVSTAGWYKPVIQKASEHFYAATKYSKESPTVGYAFTHPEPSRISKIINQLISNLLWINRSEEDLKRLYQPFMEFIGKYDSVNIFSLNHDLLIEELFSLFGLSYCDGFSRTNSNLRKHQGEYLRVFQNDFSSAKIRLVKLHGSIDTYHYGHGKQEGTTLYLSGDGAYCKPQSSEDLYWTERIDESGKVVQNMNNDFIPKFITGKHKKETILKNPMYSRMYELYTTQIQKNDDLLICGYSYGDKHLDEYLSRFTSTNGPRIININPVNKFPYAAPEIIHMEFVRELLDICV
jgi:hypothetical protein